MQLLVYRRPFIYYEGTLSKPLLHCATFTPWVTYVTDLSLGLLALTFFYDGYGVFAVLCDVHVHALHFCVWPCAPACWSNGPTGGPKCHQTLVDRP